jgi:hypothetical protein
MSAQYFDRFDLDYRSRGKAHLRLIALAFIRRRTRDSLIHCRPVVDRDNRE